MTSVLLVAVGGACGSVLRYLVGLGLNRQEPTFVATLVVNLVGCFLFGVVATVLAENEGWAAWAQPLVLVGVLGGFTTFSAFGWETVRLFEAGRLTLALVNAVGQVAVGCAGVLGGLASAKWIAERI